MISVSRAAGYGKFTQTNDSHLPEARDTIEGWGVGRAVVMRRVQKRRNGRQGSMGRRRTRRRRRHTQ